MIQHQIDRIQRVWIQTVALKYIPSEVTLERGEAELIVSVALQDELNESVAQSADAVIENDGIGRLHWTSASVRPENRETQNPRSVSPTTGETRTGHPFMEAVPADTPPAPGVLGSTCKILSR